MKKVVLITGVSSGFGRATAKLLAENGYTVYGTVRSGEDRQESYHLLKMDLTDHASITAGVNAVVAKEGRIDILINNAGMHTGGSIETSPIENVELQINTNLLGTIRLTREVLPVMRKQSEGTIINISSIGGLMGLPFQGYYSSVKFALEGFSEALRMEVKAFNIKVVVVNPGDFHTNNSANRRNFLTPNSGTDPYQQQFDKSLSVIEKDEANGWEPEVLAKKILAIANNKNPNNRYIIASFEQKLAVVLKYVLPNKLFASILSDHYKVGKK